MIKLKSVSKPVPKAAARAATEAAGAALDERKEHPGSAGTPSEPSRVAKKRLAVGKLPPAVRETVIGPDERVRIYDTDLSPWRMICSLAITGANGREFIGTGWLVGPKTVITAGHCVLDMGEMEGWASEITVTAGRDDDLAPFNRIVATRFSTTDRWKNSQATTPDMDFDIGCIHLDEPLGNTTGWFAVLALPADDLPGYQVNVAGYPGSPGGGRHLYHHRNSVLRVTDRRLFYDVDTYGGQSGAPVWIHEVAGGPPKVVGIHAYGIGGTPSDFGIVANSAPRIIPEVVTLIERWVENDS